jgi:succinate dehydrogenase / fumarate reductase, cytochrome b subunit
LRLLAFWRSTVGKKAVMAVTGAVWVVYVIAHAAGNLLVYAGPAALNAYAATLQSTLPLLWGTRIVLLLALILHVIAAVQLTRLSRVARPDGYIMREPQASTWGSRSMRWGGLVLILFIVFHILHLTTGTIDPPGVFNRHDVHRNVVAGFQIWWVALLYVGAMVALGLHLLHGVWSAPRTVGLTRPSRTPLTRRAAWIVGIGVWAAFTSIPIAIFAGLVR